eukprot:840117-Amphidinium_carterae.1
MYAPSGLEAQGEELGVQTEGGEVDWRHFDGSRALKQLSSKESRLRMLSLRRLHVRWFHCGASHMRQILETAGVSGPALREVDAVVQALLSVSHLATPRTQGSLHIKNDKQLQ